MSFGNTRYLVEISEFVVERSEEFGGKKVFTNYESIEEAFSKEVSISKHINGCIVTSQIKLISLN